MSTQINENSDSYLFFEGLLRPIRLTAGPPPRSGEEAATEIHLGFPDEPFPPARAAVERRFPEGLFRLGIRGRLQILPPIRHGLQQKAPARQDRVGLPRDVPPCARPGVLFRHSRPRSRDHSEARSGREPPDSGRNLPRPQKRSAGNCPVA